MSNIYLTGIKSFNRIADFLHREEIPQYITNLDSSVDEDVVYHIQDAKFTWNKNCEDQVLFLL